MKSSIKKVNNRGGPPVGLPPDFKNQEQDQLADLYYAYRDACGIFWHHRKIWLTCRNSVCQDFFASAQSNAQAAMVSDGERTVPESVIGNRSQTPNYDLAILPVYRDGQFCN